MLNSKKFSKIISLLSDTPDQNLIPPNGMLGCLIVQSITVLFLAALIAWWLVFSCLRIHVLVKPPMDEATLKFFDDNSLIDIYYALAKGNMAAFKQNKAVGDRKSQALYRGYVAMNIAVGAMTILFALLMLQQWVAQ
jgi:hypothetical protein